MMFNEENINVFLMDGNADGRYECSIDAASSIAYKIPRTMIDKCSELEHIEQSGIYFLFGVDEKDRPAVYIGQANLRKNGNGLLSRVKEPHKGFEEWSEVIMLTSVKNDLGASELSFLENAFYNLAIEANRYVVKNGNDPNQGNFTRSKMVSMNKYINQASLFMGVLGYKLFKPVVSDHDRKTGNELYFDGIKASVRAIRTSEGIALLKGSRISRDTADTCRDNIKKLREEHKSKVKNCILKEDIKFDSPSQALSFATGNNISGPKQWKTEEGIPLKDLL